MTTAQETSNGHCVSPPPCSVPAPAELNRIDPPTDKANNIPYPSYASAIDTTVLPDRCQFFFSDGRQCGMARSDIHPSLCTYHTDREEQLFGDPYPFAVASKMTLPELYSACRDLTTAAGVNRALGQVFRLLVLRRITRQEAATFCHLAQLLLRTISAARQEDLTSELGSSASAAKGYQLPRKGYQQDALFAGNKDALSPLNKSADTSSIGVPSSRESDDAASIVIPSESAVADEPRDLSAPSPVNKVAGCANGTNPVILSESAPADKSEDLSVSRPRNEVQNEPGALPASPDFASALSRSRTALAAAAPHTQVTKNRRSDQDRLPVFARK